MALSDTNKVAFSALDIVLIIIVVSAIFALLRHALNINMGFLNYLAIDQALRGLFRILNMLITALIQNT